MRRLLKDEGAQIVVISVLLSALALLGVLVGGGLAVLGVSALIGGSAILATLAGGVSAIYLCLRGIL